MIAGIVAGAAIPAPPPGSWYRFDPTGAEVEFEVPVGFVSCTAYCVGAGGGSGIYSTTQGNSGAGGYSLGTFSVTPGEVLIVRVGESGNGGSRDPSDSHGGAASYPGGGNGAWGDTWCGGGGGYSGVFRQDLSPLLIAGGGGGGSGFSTHGGAGGGTNGGSGAAGGGTQVSGGTGTYPGSSLQGGNANGGDNTTSTVNDCGGGGGGFFGGGAPSGDGLTGGGGSGHVGTGVSGETYAGSGISPPAELPVSINGESTSGLGIGRIGVNRLIPVPLVAPSGGPGAVWLEFS